MTDGPNDEVDIVEVYPSGERVPVEEIPDMGPESDYLIDTQSADDLTMYAFEFAEQAATSGATLSDWTPELDLDALIEDPTPILETIDAASDPDIARAWSATTVDSTTLRELATSFGYYLLSRVVIHARITDQVNTLPVSVLDSLAELEISTSVDRALYATVFLTHTHPEFPKEAVFDNPILYRPLNNEFPYNVDPIVVLWHVSDALFYEAADSVLANGLVPRSEFENPMVVTGTRDKWIESVVYGVICGFIQGSHPLPIVFSGDPGGELTGRVISTLPDQSVEDYRALIQWGIENHTTDYTPEEFLEACDAPADCFDILEN